jgi:hypothetical protein
MEFVITNQSDLDISELEPLITSLMSFGQERLGFHDPPSLFLKSDSENASDLLGKTGFYDPMEQEITAFVDQRHPKDILRSISHELVHHAQNCRGEFDGEMEIGEGYAQKNPKLREMEKEAYLEGNLILRDWEDSRKKQLQESIYYDSGYIIEEKESMSTKIWKDRELNTLLMEKWGYKMPVNEGLGHDCAKTRVMHEEDTEEEGPKLPAAFTMTEQDDEAAAKTTAKIDATPTPTPTPPPTPTPTPTPPPVDPLAAATGGAGSPPLDALRNLMKEQEPAGAETPRGIKKAARGRVNMARAQEYARKKDVKAAEIETGQKIGKATSSTEGGPNFKKLARQVGKKEEKNTGDLKEFRKIVREALRKKLGR